MANERVSSSNRQREVVFWLLFGVFSLVILILGAIIWALMTTSTIENGAPRTAYERQLRVLEAAVEESPDNTKAWGDYIKLLVNGGQIADAERAIADADAALGKRSGVVATEVARIELLGGNLDPALARVDEALSLIGQETQAEIERLASKGVVQHMDPANRIGALLLKAEIQIARGDTAAALAAYDEALELDSTMADVMVERGLLHEKSGDRERAAADFRGALAFIPDYQPALEALARVEQ